MMTFDRAPYICASKRFPIAFVFHITDDEQSDREIAHLLFYRIVEAIKSHPKCTASVEAMFVSSDGCTDFCPGIRDEWKEALQFCRKKTSKLSDLLNLAYQKIDDRLKQFFECDLAFYAPMVIVISNGWNCEADEDTLSMIEKRCSSSTQRLANLVIPLMVGVGGHDFTDLNRYASFFTGECIPVSTKNAVHHFRFEWLIGEYFGAHEMSCGLSKYIEDYRNAANRIREEIEE